MTWLDGSLVIAYMAVMVGVSLYKRPSESDESGFLLSGRTLSLPAFVATLVSTWYGGILGVGEFGYSYGVSQWVVFALPYYVFALLFAWFLAPKIRAANHVTIPDAVGATFGTSAGKAAAVGIAVLVNPAPYLLMGSLVVLFFLPDLSLPLVSIALSLLTAGYVMLGGFRAVVNTDRVQIVLMYLGFLLLVVFAWMRFGSPLEMWEALPATHRDPSGGHSTGYILVWFFIAASRRKCGRACWQGLPWHGRLLLWRQVIERWGGLAHWRGRRGRCRACRWRLSSCHQLLKRRLIVQIGLRHDRFYRARLAWLHGTQRGRLGR
jgi:SSS family solute:Na+ symporter